MKSTSGNCFVFGLGAIYWASMKQAIVALSLTEREYVVVTTTTYQAVWLRRVLSHLN